MERRPMIQATFRVVPPGERQQQLMEVLSCMKEPVEALDRCRAIRFFRTWMCPLRVTLERGGYFTESFKTAEAQPLVLRGASAETPC